jgi:CHASE2 domain-containing sensor protein
MGRALQCGLRTMSDASRSFPSKTSRIAGAALTAGLGVLLVSTPLGDGLAHRSYDSLFAFRPPVPVGNDEVVIIDMDEESEKELGQPSIEAWDRTLHTRLLKELTARNARVVVFDVLIRNTNAILSSADREMLQAASAHGHVFFAAKYDVIIGPTNQPTHYQFERSFGGQTAVEQVGLVEYSTTTDQMIRQHAVPYRELPSLAWRAARLTSGDLPANAAGERWVNYYGPPLRTLPHVSYFKLLSGTLPPTLNFSNKVVFVGGRAKLGPTAGSGTDYLPTPFPGLAPGVEVSATVYLNLARGDWLRRLPRSVEAVVLTLLGLAAVYVWPVRRPWAAVGLGFLVVTGGVVLAVVLFRSLNFWFPWLLVAAVQVPCAVGWAVLAHTRLLRGEVEALATQLSIVRQPGAAKVDSAPTVVNPAAPAGSKAPVIPDHTLVRCVGSGTYGEVWLAHDLVGAARAVKIVHRCRFPNNTPFEREFKGIQKYSPISRSHPGWIDILHVGRNEAGGYFFYIMEAGDDEATGRQIDLERYVPRTLAGELHRRGGLPLAEVVEITVALADALEHLHRHGLIHRDIKPANVIFVNGAPKFADIGLVTDIRSTGRDVSWLGTEGYMAPEGPGTPAADVFGLGMMIYEASTGRARQSYPEFPSAVFERAEDDAERQLVRIIMKACEEDVRHRYPSAAALHADLARLQGSVARGGNR